jgi:pimeloyl-ACP methyl ester carboxylesterase
MRVWSRVALVCASLLVFDSTVVVARAQQPALSGQIWEGKLKVRPGVEVQLIVRATPRADGSFDAELDSPDEGLKGLKLSAVTLDKSRIGFELEVSAAKYDGRLNAEGTEATGTWSQRGASLPLTFSKKDKPTPEPKIVGKEQIWEGKLPVGVGVEYRLVVRLNKTEAGDWLGRLDSLEEGFKGLKLTAITLDKARLAFDLKVSSAKYDGKLNAEGTEAVGTWSQNGANIPLTFKKTEKVTVVRRPQTPTPPFPYKSENVRYENKAGGVTLSGTLTEPQGSGPFPAVILISGSGAQDRDETIFQHKPFLVLADALCRRGVAVLRVDDRGVGGSSGSTPDSTSEDFAGDVLAGIAFLKSRPMIDARKIGLIGHSEGGLIAPLVAARSSDVAFIVLMAGTGMSGEDVIYQQGQLLGKAAGADAKALERQGKIQRQLFDVIKTEKDHAKAVARMREAVKKTISELSEAERKNAGDVEAALDAQIKRVDSPWFRFFLTFDPRTAFAQVRCPVLALNGDKDLQVAPKENLAEIEKALKKAGNTRVTIRELPGLNHLFQTCKTGAVAEYAVIEETIAPAALKVIGDWVLSQTEGR